MSTPDDFKTGDRVIYIPYHADGPEHPDCERGAVSSTNDRFVFVRFDRIVSRLGWDGTTAQACKPDQLKKEYGK